MSSCILDGRITIDVCQLTQTESIYFTTRICETIDDHSARVALKRFTHSAVQLVIRYCTPVLLWILEYTTKFIEMLPLIIKVLPKKKFLSFSLKTL